MAAAAALVLRTDGDATIGGGHVMRSLALAQAWSDSGGRIGFCAARLAPALRQRLDRQNFACADIEAPAGGAADAAATIGAAARLGAPLVVVDGYHFSTGYRRDLRRAGLKVVALDDNCEIGTYVDDLVINPNRHAAPALYWQRAEHTRLLLGTDYALLRREFRHWRGPPRTFPAAPRRVLVTLGAADPNDVTSAVIASLGTVMAAGTALDIVVGGSNPHADAIAARARGLPASHLVRDAAEDMSHLMAAADVAVCAGGSTMWELAFMGVPFIPVIIAGNQRLGVRAMVGDGYSGVEGEAVERDLPAVFAALATDAVRRRELSQCGRRLVDGRGGERVCAALRALVDDPAVV